jgi:hypothetical protein
MAKEVQGINRFLISPVPDGPEVFCKSFGKRQADIAEADNADRLIEKFF